MNKSTDVQNIKSAENIIKTADYLTLNTMKITGILQKHNQFPQSDQKYQPLRKNIGQSKQKVIKKQLGGVSYVSRRLQSLSPQQAQLIKNTAYIPVNCGLRVTSNEEKQKKALSQRYIAINLQQKMRSKPITPNTFKNVVKNQKVEVVYEYHCPNGEQQNNFQQYNQVMTQSKRLEGDRQNYQLKSQEELLEYSRHQRVGGEGRNGDTNGIARNSTSPGEQQGVVRNSTGSSSGHVVAKSTSPKGENKQGVNGIVQSHPVNPNTVINYSPPPTTPVQTIRPSPQTSNQLIRDSTSPQNKMRSSQKKIESPIHQQANIYTSQEYRTGGYQHRYAANDDNAELDGPAFFQTEGRNKYNQIGKNSRQEYEIRSKGKSTGNIAIGGRSKSSTKNTIEDFQSNIGINSRHHQNQKNMYSTKDYSKRDLSKEEALEGLETEVKGEYYLERDDGNEDEKSRVRDYVQNVQSRIIVGEGRQQVGEDAALKHNRKKVETSREAAIQYALQGQQNRIPLSPQIQERKKKISEYQNTGTKGYNFKKNEESDAKRKKEEYKYNLFSMCDQQFNLKCATGLCTPNQILATSPKREGWK